MEQLSETPQQDPKIPKVFKTCVITGLNKDELSYLEHQLDALQRRQMLTTVVKEGEMEITVAEKRDAHKEPLGPLEFTKLTLVGIIENFPNAKFEFSES